MSSFAQNVPANPASGTMCLQYNLADCADSGDLFDSKTRSDSLLIFHIKFIEVKASLVVNFSLLLSLILQNEPHLRQIFERYLTQF